MESETEELIVLLAALGLMNGYQVNLHIEEGK